MEKKEILKDQIQQYEESVEFFSNNNKQTREQWVVTQFLTNLSISFTDKEIESNHDDPPDILFRDAKFEIKEILDKDRQRHRDYKQKLEKAKNAKMLSDLLESYSPQEITLQNIAELIEQKLNEYLLDPQLYPKIDMLFYVNLLDVHFVKNSAYSFSDKETWQKWRSVSMVESGKINFVFWASDNAPDFIKSNTGKFIKNKNL